MRPHLGGTVSYIEPLIITGVLPVVYVVFRQFLRASFYRLFRSCPSLRISVEKSVIQRIRSSERSYVESIIDLCAEDLCACNGIASVSGLLPCP